MSCNYSTDIPWNLTFYFLCSQQFLIGSSSSFFFDPLQNSYFPFRSWLPSARAKKLLGSVLRNNFLERMRDNGATSAQKGWSPRETISFKKKKNERIDSRNL